ncbi:MAG: glycerol-3-phosphate 1-O-acyltransferase PlsY [Alphaproteobacteria bacterium]
MTGAPGVAALWQYAAALVAGYALGSIPFGWIVTRLAGLGDIRAIGSGNIGATNVLRTGRKGLAALTLALDGAKGAAAVLLAAHLAPATAMAAGLGALLGHMFPVWLGFKGGKGVATALGVLAALAWPVAAVAVGVWLIVALGFRYSSLGALAAIVASPFAAWALACWQLALFVAVVGLLVAARHRANIVRLIAGTEPRIGERA